MSKNISIRINANTNIATLQTIAERALATAPARRAVAMSQKSMSEGDDSKPKQRKKVATAVPGIEKQKRMLMQGLATTLAPGYKLVMEDSVTSSACGVMKVYVASEHNAYLAAIKNRIKGVRRPSPVRSYALFYRSVTEKSEIGAIGIYGHQASERGRQALNDREIFGAKVKKVDFEYGVRPFAYVTLWEGWQKSANFAGVKVAKNDHDTSDISVSH